MNPRSHPDSHDLNAAMTSLHAMLAASERRYASMVKLGRWGAIAFVAFVVLVASIASNFMSVAQAVNGGGGIIQAESACDPMDIKTMQTEQCALQQVSTFFMTLNGLMTGMIQTPDVQKWMEHEPWKDMLAHAKETFPEEMAKQMVFGGMVAQTVINAGLLINRIRDDSDELQTFPGGPIGALRHELEIMNRALAAIPAMANEMNVMNRQMSVMAYGVGSTMGRMGNVLPW